MNKSRVLPTIILITVQSCGASSAGGGEWAGTTRDSAGVTIVDNPAVGSWGQGDQWRITPTVTIGTAEGEEHFQFGQIAGMTVDAAGQIHVFDFQAAQIRSFDPDGNYLRTIGKKGSGPGEIAMGMGVFLGAGDSLLLPDLGARRISAFPIDGSTGESFPLSLSSSRPMKFVVSSNGTLVAQLRVFTGGGGAPIQLGDNDLVVTIREDGMDTLATISAGQTINFASDLPVIRIFAPEPMWTLGGDDAVFVAPNDQTTINRFVDGKLASVIVRDVQIQEVTEADERLLRGAVEDALNDQPIPPRMRTRILETLTVADYFPTLLQVLGGPDGTLWVQRFTRFSEMDEEERENFNPLDIGSRWWEVFDSEGRLLGDLQMPAKFQPIGFTDTQVYGIWRDELDVQYAMVASIDRP